MHRKANWTSHIIITEAANPSSEQDLIKELLTDYNPNGRPVLIPDTIIKVEFGIEIVQIIEVVSVFSGKKVKGLIIIKLNWLSHSR